MEQTKAVAQDNKAAPATDEQIEMGMEGERGSPRPSVLIQLSQVSYLRARSSHYTIFDKRFLSVYKKKFGRKAKQYWIDLALLDSAPHFFVRYDLHALYTAGGLFALGVILALASLFPKTPWYQHMWSPVTALALSGAFVALLVFLQRSQSLVRFHSQNGDAVLFEMFNNSPNRKEFGAFAREVVQHIQAAQKSDKRKLDQKLGAELREHRRLKDQGILSEEIYANARDKILRRHRQSQMKSPAGTAATAAAQTDDSDIIEVTEVTVSNGKWSTKTADIELFEPVQKRA